MQDVALLRRESLRERGTQGERRSEGDVRVLEGERERPIRLLVPEDFGRGRLGALTEEGREGRGEHHVPDPRVPDRSPSVQSGRTGLQGGGRRPRPQLPERPDLLGRVDEEESGRLLRRGRGRPAEIAGYVLARLHDGRSHEDRPVARSGGHEHRLVLGSGRSAADARGAARPRGAAVEAGRGRGGASARRHPSR